MFTNVLATTYYNFKVYNGQYIILDYNTSDGGNRTDATLAGWNWESLSDAGFQQFRGIQLPCTYRQLGTPCCFLQGMDQLPPSGRCARYLSAAQTGRIYDDRIILIVEDDIADNVSNPKQRSYTV